MASEWILRFTKETKGRLRVLLSESSLCEYCFSSLYIEFCELEDKRSTVVWEEENKERFFNALFLSSLFQVMGIISYMRYVSGSQISCLCRFCWVLEIYIPIRVHVGVHCGPIPNLTLLLFFLNGLWTHPELDHSSVADPEISFKWGR